MRVRRLARTPLEVATGDNALFFVSLPIALASCLARTPLEVATYNCVMAFTVAPVALRALRLAINPLQVATYKLNNFDGAVVTLVTRPYVKA